MIEINVTVDIDPIEIDVTVDLVPPSVGGVTVHNELTGRDAPEAHPGSSISLEGVEWADVQAMAGALDENEAIAVDGVTIIGTGELADPYKVADDTFIDAPDTALATEPTDTDYLPIFTNAWFRLTWLSIKNHLKTYFDTIYGKLFIQFGRTITTAGTIEAGDVGKMVKFNSATDLDLAVGTAMPVGSFVEFLIQGAGLPVFTVAAGQAIAAYDITGAKNVMLRRLEDVGGIQQFDVI